MQVYVCMFLWECVRVLMSARRTTVLPMRKEILLLLLRFVEYQAKYESLQPKVPSLSIHVININSKELKKIKPKC